MQNLGKGTHSCAADAYHVNFFNTVNQLIVFVELFHTIAPKLSFSNL